MKKSTLAGFIFLILLTATFSCRQQLEDEQKHPAKTEDAFTNSNIKPAECG